MYFQVYDANGKLRFKSDNCPMARSALDLVISEGEVRGNCPDLVVLPEPKEAPHG